MGRELLFTAQFKAFANSCTKLKFALHLIYQPDSKPGLMQAGLFFFEKSEICQAA
jgi:hypothetical protein